MKNYIKKGFYSTMILFQILLLSCKEEGAGKILVGQETKDFTVFKPGTWWLYKNSVTNFKDTWKVVEYQQYIIDHDEKSLFDVEEIILTIYTENHDTFKFYISNTFLDFVTNKYFGYAQVGYFDLEMSSTGSCDNNKIRLLSHDTMSGKIVKKEFDVFPEPCSTFFPKYFLWERNVGLVKMVYPNNDTLILIDKHIIQ